MYINCGLGIHFNRNLNGLCHTDAQESRGLKRVADLPGHGGDEKVD
jgi:hypothetical protein